MPVASWNLKKSSLKPPKSIYEALGQTRQYLLNKGMGKSALGTVTWVLPSTNVEEKNLMN